MEDKKNVPFVSGLALILSALALLLIGINQINPSPYDEATEKVFEQRFNDIESRMDMKITARLQQLDRAESDAALRELKIFKAQLQDWINTSSASGYNEQVLTIAKQIDELVKKMEAGKGGTTVELTPAPAEAPAAAPAAEAAAPEAPKTAETPAAPAEAPAAK